jgi:hypothetical protein
VIWLKSRSNRLFLCVVNCDEGDTKAKEGSKLRRHSAFKSARNLEGKLSLILAESKGCLSHMLPPARDSLEEEGYDLPVPGVFPVETTRCWAISLWVVAAVRLPLRTVWP